jgi:hypothetical protein
MSLPVLVEASSIEQMIYLVRGQRVMLSTDLAMLYGVQPKVLVQAVKRHLDCFPGDFMVRLTLDQAKASRSQFVTLKRGRHAKHPPYAFTEQGVAMLASVLRSPRAIQVNIAILRAFVRLRRLVAASKELAGKLAALESKVEGHDGDIRRLFDAIRELMEGPEEPPKKIGFKP